MKCNIKNSFCIRLAALIFLIAWLSMPISAQTLSKDVQAAFDACVAMRNAVGAGSTTGLQAASQALKSGNVNYFAMLRCLDEDKIPLDGHFVFDYEFADSLVAGRDVYKFAQQYGNRCTNRAVSSSGKVFAKTCCVKSSSSTKYSFVSKGRQELAVVAEPGGLITLRVFDKTNNQWYNDTENVKKGQYSRVLVFNLPDNKKNVIEIEIINTTKKDISFVLIGN